MTPIPIFVKIIISIPDEWLAEKIAIWANFRYTLIKIENLLRFIWNENFENEWIRLAGGFNLSGRKWPRPAWTDRKDDNI